MASTSRDPNGRKRILFTDGNGDGKVIRLGKMPVKDAEMVRTHVEALNAAKIAGNPIDNDTAKWLRKIGGELHAKLAALGLTDPRITGAATVAEYVASYAQHRADVLQGTRTNYGIVAARLLAFFPGTTPMRNIVEGDADHWLVCFKTKYAGPTVSKSIKVARQFWAQAIRDGIATVNPFAYLRTLSEENTARAFFVDPTTIQRVLDACPDDEWRLLIALARYGGLRTPSVPLTLQWPDVNWERDRVRVVAPKTKHDDGGERWVPLFPELRVILAEAFDRAELGAVHVITRYRDTNANLRTHLSRICRRAGVKTWPRLFQNSRASRETELCEAFPIRVVAEWLGNSPKTAPAHFTQTTEDHFRQAAQGGAKSGALTAHFAAQQHSAEVCTVSQKSTEGYANWGDMRTVTTTSGTTQNYLMTPTGFEPVSRP
ncbi:MAG: site-specific integrase [Planctomycetes bacterium]|nr:site-specific integrase [Planctomycetota bacterium]